MVNKIFSTWNNIKSEGEFNQYLNSDDNLGKNIYVETGTPVKVWAKRFRMFHYVIKNRIFVPLLKIFKLFFDKHLIKEVPDKIENKNIKIFNNAWEQSIIDWYKHFMKNTYSLTDDEIDKAIKNKSETSYLRTIKELQLTLILEDTAYREFYNMLVYNIVLEFQKEYPQGSKIKHLMYTSKNINDIKYYTAQQILMR